MTARARISIPGIVVAGFLVVAAITPCGSAVAQDASAGAIANVLRHGSVYASPHANPTLSAAEARAIAREVARKDRGRIKVVLVSAAEASRAGGVTALANDLDHSLGGPGTVFVTAGSRSWLVTTYPDTNAATGAVQNAFDSHRALFDQLREAVDGIAAVDPGPQQQRQAPSSPSGAPVSVSRGGHVSSTVWLVLAIVIGVPLLIVALVLAGRRWRAHGVARETFEDDLADARQELVSLGDDVGDLDIDESMPAADPAGKRAYEDALDQYQRAERLLGEDTDVRRLARAKAALAEGRRLMNEARNRLDRPPSKPA